MGFLRLFTQDEAACKSGVADSFLSDGVTNIYIYSVLLQQQDRADRFVGASVKAGNASFIFRPFLLTGSLKFSITIIGRGCSSDCQREQDGKCRRADNNCSVMTVDRGSLPHSLKRRSPTPYIPRSWLRGGGGYSSSSSCYSCRGIANVQ